MRGGVMMEGYAEIEAKAADREDAVSADMMQDEVLEFDPYKYRVSMAERLRNEHKYEEAFEIYSQYAEKGDHLSKCRLGEMYYEGQGVDKRPAKAFALIKESVDPGIPETVYQLGRCYFMGIGTSVDYELGYEMIITAADKGYPPAENFIAAIYFDGEYVDKDVDKAMSWLEKAVDHDDPKALYNMGNVYYEGKYRGMNKTLAVRLWKRSAELNYAPALGRLGASYLEGEGKIDEGLEYLEKAVMGGDYKAVEPYARYHIKNRSDKPAIEKTVKLLKTAIANGNKNVCYDLGMIYSHFSDLIDYGKACECFEEGHKNGDVRCSFEYAILKLRGTGTSTDEETAFKILLDIAEKGHVPSFSWVGHCYFRGVGVNSDKIAARKWFERGDDKGNAYCTMRLGCMYIYGVGARLDDERGIELLHRSFKKGESQAAFELGKYYEELLKDDDKSIPDALFWYMEGAERDNCDCIMKLAGHYESGAFITRSEEKAFDLYKRAYKLEESPVAAAEIGRCYEDGIGTEPDIGAALNWYLRAAKRNSFACWRLYNIYMGRNDGERALFWLRRSAAKGLVTAMVELAKIYESGTLVPKSELMAMKWYHGASDEKNEFAKARFEELIGSDPQDTPELSSYDRITRRIGEEGDYDSIVKLAESLRDGTDMPADIHKANMWFEIGSQLGVRGAKAGLKTVDTWAKADKKSDGKQMTLD